MKMLHGSNVKITDNFYRSILVHDTVQPGECSPMFQTITPLPPRSPAMF